MNTLYIPKSFTYCREVKDADDTSGMLRIYRNSPASIEIQVRSVGPITETGRGVSRKMIAGVSLTVREAEQLRDGLDAFLSEF